MLWVRLMKALSLIACLIIGCLSLPAHSETAVEKYNLHWITDSSQGHEFVKSSIQIRAPLKQVWEVIIDPNHYSDWTNEIIAKTNKVKPGERIEVWTNLHSCTGKTHSQEKITVVDHEVYALAWERNMGFGIHTQHWQFLIPSTDGQSVTYYTGLKIPNPYGYTLHWFGTMKKLADFLNGFAHALKERSEYGVSSDTQELDLGSDSDPLL
jgi:hypothetical protein